MQKKIQLPKEGIVEPDEASARHLIDSDDVEGHRISHDPEPQPFQPRLPSTGGEAVPSDDEVKG